MGFFCPLGDLEGVGEGEARGEEECGEGVGFLTCWGRCWRGGAAWEGWVR